MISAYPGSYGEAVAGKIGRNAASSWTQSGHLEGRTHKVRIRAHASPATVAYAMLLGGLDGSAGELLFATLYARAQDASDHTLRELAKATSQRGWLDYRSIGSVTEVKFSWFELEEAS